MHVQQANKVAQKLKSEYNNKNDNNKDCNTRNKGLVFSPIEQHTVQAGTFPQLRVVVWGC